MRAMLLQFATIASLFVLSLHGHEVSDALDHLRARAHRHHVSLEVRHV